MRDILNQLRAAMEGKNVREEWKNEFNYVHGICEAMQTDDWLGLINKLAHECVLLLEAVHGEEELSACNLIIIRNNLMYMGMIANLREGDSK